VASAAVALALASGCGGGTRQDAGEARATFPVAVPLATFPSHQLLAQRSEMRIAVRNVGTHTIPNVAATIEADQHGTSVEAFARHIDTAGVQSSSRPVWVIEDAPVNGDSAASNTWSLGPLRAGATKTFVWRVAAVHAGRYRIRYRLSGSLTGRSQLQLRSGAAPQGSFAVAVSGRPVQTQVRPDGTIVHVPGT
jgi:plasmid stability protein